MEWYHKKKDHFKLDNFCERNLGGSRINLALDDIIP